MKQFRKEDPNRCKRLLRGGVVETIFYHSPYNLTSNQGRALQETKQPIQELNPRYFPTGRKEEGFRFGKPYSATLMYVLHDSASRIESPQEILLEK